MMNIFYVLLVMLFLFTGFCRADIYVVTHRDNPVQALSHDQLRDLYLARSQSLPNGEGATIYESGEADLRARFILSALSMRERQFDAYWARLVFAGRVLPLKTVDQESELMSHLSNNTHAIGYTDGLPESDSVKTLLVINE
jgi:ABC-type phosphate transport system substrate-binding protein